MKYNVYIDESGEAGIDKVRDGNRPGASPYFVLGAVVCQPTAEVFAKNTVQDFKDQIGKTSCKHATDLDHFEKVLFARNLGALPVRYFGVISKKETLSNYKDTIDGNPQHYYNKCLKYLLEIICRYLKKYVDSPDDLRIVLEHRNHDYDTMYRFLQKVKDKPIYPQSRVLQILNPFAISTKPKGEDDMLEIADFVAHAIFQITNRSKSNFWIPEPRYLSELSSRFAGDSDGRLLNAGLKCIHNLDQIGLDPEIVKFLRACRVKSPSGTPAQKKK